MGAFENDNTFKILSEVMHSLSGLVQTKDHRLWLVCMCVCGQNQGGEEFHGVWSLTGRLFYGPPARVSARATGLPLNTKPLQRDEMEIRQSKWWTDNWRTVVMSRWWTFFCETFAKGCCRTPILGSLQHVMVW